MADIGYLDAWRLWLDGRSTLGNDLFGIPMIWYGRVGKIAAFVGGMTVVLDLVGPSRIRQFAQRVKAAQPTGLTNLLLLVLLGVTFEVAALVVLALRHFGIDTISDETFQLLMFAPFLISVAGIPAVSSFLLRRLASVFDTPRAEQVVRWLAVAMIAAGFHFDLLAS